jgi:PmbA protein
VGRLGAREIESGAHPVVLSRDVASDLVEVFFSSRSPFYAENVQLGMSRLADKLGKKIASEAITIVDDPLHDGPESREFDGEGIPCAAMSVIDKGVLTGFYYTLYAARRAGAQPTGHGGRGGHKSSISTSPSNVLVENGAVDEAGLLADVDRGVYVSYVEGLHASVDPISGDFSVGAKGRLIEKGVLGDPIKNFTIAGNFFDMLTRVTAVANDRRTDGFSSVASPAIAVADVDVSGGAEG